MQWETQLNSMERLTGGSAQLNRRLSSAQCEAQLTTRLNRRLSSTGDSAQWETQQETQLNEKLSSAQWETQLSSVGDSTGDSAQWDTQRGAQLNGILSSIPGETQLSEGSSRLSGRLGSTGHSKGHSAQLNGSSAQRGTRLTLVGGLGQFSGALSSTQQKAQWRLSSVEAQLNGHSAQREAQLNGGSAQWTLSSMEAQLNGHSAQREAQLNVRLSSVDTQLNGHSAPWEGTRAASLPCGAQCSLVGVVWCFEGWKWGGGGGGGCCVFCGRSVTEPWGSGKVLYGHCRCVWGTELRDGDGGGGQRDGDGGDDRIPQPAHSLIN
ncbi:uncharacterized protein LOC121112444 [Gallus gallus]|uniref:uncharacterized protein LOC121112444 n=1 Tax=Gallus gallus TaxID=9031 RepID=UPI001AE2C1C8|nr:uncharacterized protein LOC121112444 [Gallus gallus]